MSTIFYDDFDTGGGTVWDPDNWNTVVTGTSASISLSSGRGQITMPNGSGRAAYGYDKYTAQSSAEVVVKYEGMGSSRNSFSTIAICASGTSTKPSIMSHGVWLKIPNNGTNVTVNHTHTGSVTTAADLGFGVGTNSSNMWFRLKFSAGIIYVRAWWDGSAEPSTWNGTYDINGYAAIPAGNVVLGCETTSSTSAGGSVYFDELTYADAPSNLDVNISATPATASGTMPGGIKVVDRVITVSAATASGAMTDATAITKTNTLNNLAVNNIAEGDGTVSNNSTVGYLDANSPIRAVLLSGALGLPSDAVIGSAELQINLGIDSAITMRAHSIDETYNTSTVVYANQPSHGALMSTSKTFSTSGAKTFDVTDIVKAIQAGTAYGIELVASSGSNYITTGQGGGTNPPLLVINYASTGAGGFTATPATASGLMVDPTFSNVTNKSINAPVATGSGLAVNPTVSLVSNIEIVAEPFTGTGSMGNHGFAVPVTVPVEFGAGSGEAVDPSLITEKNALIKATPATGTGVEIQAMLEINGVIVNPELANDAYYAEILATTDSDDFWYRLDESSGTVIHDARGNTAQDADLFGDYSFNVYGPESRKAIHFEDGYAQRRAPVGKTYEDESDTDTFAFEVVLRTTEKNGMIAYGLDLANPQVITGPLYQFRNSIYLKDGKVTTNWNSLAPSGTTYELSGMQNVADGQWHHIVVAFNYGAVNDLNSGLRIYIDGKLDIRRRRDVVPGLWASPDSYFGMPDAWRNVTPLYPWQQNFIGDAMEVVFRYKDELTHDQVIELYYAAMGIVPIRVQPATGFGVIPEPKAKGNQLRALVLYNRWRGAGNTTGNLIGDERNAPSSYSETIPDEFDHDINIGYVPEPGDPGWQDLVGYRVVPVAIMQEEANPVAGPYRDPVTDLPRLINLQEDLNIDDYDLIVFRNWPDEGLDLNVFYGRGYTNDAIEDFLASVRQAVVDGKSLEVTNVNLASRLGLISGAQPIPMVVDGRYGAEKDFRAVMVNPWDEQKAEDAPYLDMHANNWNRVVANIHHLTDIINAEYISEAIINYNSGITGDIPTEWAYKLTDEPLTIGTEMIDMVQFETRLKTWVQEGPATLRPWDRYVWAVTPDGLTVGTPVYKFNNKMWQGNTEVDNPYRDYIGAAVVQPGDEWGGVRVAGKVFMNFAEAPWDAINSGAMVRQIVPPNEEIINPRDREDAEMREWDYSFSRVAFASTGGGTGEKNRLVKVANSDDVEGDFYVVDFQTRLVGVTISEKYDTENVVVPTWAQRGLLWLGVTESVPEGSVVIRPTALTATGSAPAPVTVAERSVEVNAQVALAMGVLVNPDEVDEPDVTVHTFPAEGHGEMTGYGKTITVAPLEGSGELVDNFELISAMGEQVVVYLHALTEVELYLMEGIK